MSTIALAAAAWYLPERAVPVADLPELAALCETERATCLGLGIDRVLVDDRLTAVDLAERAARQAMARIGLDPEDVDALIVIESRAPEALLVSEATQVQARLGARRALTLSVGGLGCVSITPALLMARGLLATEPDMANILVVHGSKPATCQRYRHPVTVNGDAGQAVVVARQGPLHILDIRTETSGEYWDLFQVDYRDRPAAQWAEECTSIPKYSFRLAVETRNRLRALTSSILDRNSLGQGDISCLLSQNLSLGTFGVYEDMLGMKIAEVCFDNLRQYGHLGPNDVLLNLYRAVERGQLPGGGRAVVLNVSPSAAWSVLLVQSRADAAGGPAAIHL